MSRAFRLFELLQSLRRRRRLVTAAELADEFGISVRTVYRDIAELAACGVPVVGEPGVGYLLRREQFLPPFTFTEDELDAILLGLGWVQKRADAVLARGAEDALAKIAAALPGPERDAADHPAVMTGPGKEQPLSRVPIPLLRDAVRGARKLLIRYEDLAGRRTERLVWPIGLAYMEDARMLVAWCELRGGFRHFRVDRIASADLSDRYVEPRAALVRRWKAGIEAEIAAADTDCQQPPLS